MPESEYLKVMYKTQQELSKSPNLWASTSMWTVELFFFSDEFKI